MNEIFRLDINQLKALSSEYNLEEIRDGELKKAMKSCIEMGACEELRRRFENQGELRF